MAWFLNIPMNLNRTHDSGLLFSSHMADQKPRTKRSALAESAGTDIRSWYPVVLDGAVSSHIEESGPLMKNGVAVMSGDLLSGGAEVGEQIGPSLAEEHQPRLGDPVGAPLGNGLSRNSAHQSNRRRSTEVVDKFVFIHTTIKARFTYFCQGRLSVFTVAFGNE